MSIIFAGAPMVNAIVSTTKEGNWGRVLSKEHWPFIVGIAMAALGGYLITKYAQNHRQVRLRPTPPRPE